MRSPMEVLSFTEGAGTNTLLVGPSVLGGDELESVEDLYTFYITRGELGNFLVLGLNYTPESKIEFIRKIREISGYGLKKGKIIADFVNEFHTLKRSKTVLFKASSSG